MVGCTVERIGRGGIFTPQLLLKMQAWYNASQMRAHASEIAVQRDEPARQPAQEGVRNADHDALDDLIWAFVPSLLFASFTH